MMEAADFDLFEAYAPDDAADREARSMRSIDLGHRAQGRRMLGALCWDRAGPTRNSARGCAGHPCRSVMENHLRVAADAVQFVPAYACRWTDAVADARIAAGAGARFALWTARSVVIDLSAAPICGRATRSDRDG